jgi:putative oxidoreductase
MKLGRLLLRGALGGFFFGHGTQKLYGWFGGHGLEGTSQMFESLGARPGRVNAIAAGAAEAGGGALMVLGFATPLAASAITSVMLTAIRRVHLKNGPWATNGGYEYNAVLIAAALTLAEVGPGSPSLDAALGMDMYGPGWAFAALASGVAGTVGAHLYAENQPQAATAAQTPPAEAAQEVSEQPPATAATESAA